jgi:arylformamidase
MNAEFYTREYNTRLGVTDVEGYFQRWDEMSAEARTILSYDLDLHYGAGERETIDFFPSDNSTTTLVFIHGGYWRSMAKERFSFIAPPFVNAGINVAVLEYDLCPRVTIGTIIEQCRQALVWLQKHYPTQTQKLIISGHSAGGHLTTMMFATKWSTYSFPSETIKAGIAISGLFNLDPLRYTPMNDDLRLDETEAHSWSPIHYQPQVKAPLHLMVGALESSEFKRQSRIIAETWANCTTPDIVEGCHHFNILEPFMRLSHTLI